MSKNLRLGAASIAFSQPLYIESAASIVSQKEADGPLGDLFDLVCEDPMFGCDPWESAESTLQKETATQAITRKEASAYIEKYFETYPKIKGFLDGLVKDGKEHGYVTTMFGRRRPVPAPAPP